jgi:hypothetical protein
VDGPPRHHRAQQREARRVDLGGRDGPARTRPPCHRNPATAIWWPRGGSPPRSACRSVCGSIFNVRSDRDEPPLEPCSPSRSTSSPSSSAWESQRFGRGTPVSGAAPNLRVHYGSERIALPRHRQPLPRSARSSRRFRAVVRHRVDPALDAAHHPDLLPQAAAIAPSASRSTALCSLRDSRSRRRSAGSAVTAAVPAGAPTLRAHSDLHT